MTRKHFEAIAATLEAFYLNSGCPEVIENLAAALCHDFHHFNPNFDRDRFMRAVLGRDQE